MQLICGIAGSFEFQIFLLFFFLRLQLNFEILDDSISNVKTIIVERKRSENVIHISF
jgi:hypothetical protein